MERNNNFEDMKVFLSCWNNYKVIYIIKGLQNLREGVKLYFYRDL